MATLGNSSSDDDEIYILASQQYEQSLSALSTDPSVYSGDDPYPISPATQIKYDEMDEDDFAIDKLLPVDDIVTEPATHENDVLIDKPLDKSNDKIVMKRRFAKPITESDILSKIKSR